MSGYDNHNVECDGSECVTYECAFLNVPENPVVQRVIDLWNSRNGWIPGASYRELAEALGVSPDRLIHYRPGEGRYIPPGVPKPKGN